MTLADIRPLELLALWSELDDAYNGANGYGGDTAELYAYRFDTFSPVRHGQRRISSTDALEAEARRERAERLHSLLTLFAKQRDCTITVNGRRLGRWLLASEFDHRVHVRVAERVVRNRRASDRGEG